MIKIQVICLKKTIPNCPRTADADSFWEQREIKLKYFTFSHSIFAIFSPTILLVIQNTILPQPFSIMFSEVHHIFHLFWDCFHPVVWLNHAVCHIFLCYSHQVTTLLTHCIRLSNKFQFLYQTLRDVAS